MQSSRRKQSNDTKNQKNEPTRIEHVQSFTLQLQWPHGSYDHIKHGTMDIMKEVQLGIGKFNINSCVYQAITKVSY